MLSDGQLLRQKGHLVKLNKILPDMYLRAVYGESVMMPEAEVTADSVLMTPRRS